MPEDLPSQPACQTAPWIQATAKTESSRRMRSLGCTFCGANLTRLRQNADISSAENEEGASDGCYAHVAPDASPGQSYALQQDLREGTTSVAPQGVNKHWALAPEKGHSTVSAIRPSFHSPPD